MFDLWYHAVVMSLIRSIAFVPVQVPVQVPVPVPNPVPHPVPVSIVSVRCLAASLACMVYLNALNRQ
jgi:hypothetical protein